MGSIVDFQSYRRRRVHPNQSTEDAVVQAVMDHFKDLPIHILADAIQAARDVIADGRGFITAMDAATRTVCALAPLYAHADSNIDGIEHLRERRDQDTAALLTISEHMIRAHFNGQPEHEIVAAISRAYRVLKSGGTFCGAIYHATNIDVATL